MRPDRIRIRRGIAPIGFPFKDCLVPADEESAERMGKVPLGEVAEIKFIKARSAPQNRLYWGVLNHVAGATEWESAETLHECLKVRLGYFQTGKTPAGKLVVIPRSTAFEAMPHEEFCDYMKKAIDLICMEVLGGYDSARLVREVEAMLGLPPLSGFDAPLGTDISPAGEPL